MISSVLKVSLNYRTLPINETNFIESMQYNYTHFSKQKYLKQKS